MPRVIHFEITADDPERAARFYTAVFGWEIAKWEGDQPYWLITTGSPDEPGIDGAIMLREVAATGDNPTAFICTIDVPNIDETIRFIEENGGQVIREKVEVPGVGWHTYCLDTEGNTFGIMQQTTSA